MVLYQLFKGKSEPYNSASNESIWYYNLLASKFISVAKSRLKQINCKRVWSTQLVTEPSVIKQNIQVPDSQIDYSMG